MSHASFSYDAGEVKDEKVVFPCIRIWGSNSYVFLNDSLALRKNAFKDTIETEEHYDCVFKESAPAPPNATVTLRITAQDGTEFPRVEQYNEWRYLSLNNEEGLRLSVDPSAEWGDRKAGDLAGRLANTCRKPLPPGTVTTIKFYNDPTREKRIDVEVEEPKDWLPVSVEDRAGDDIIIERWDGDNDNNKLFIQADEAAILDIKGATELRDHLDRWISERKAIESAEAAQ